MKKEYVNPKCAPVALLIEEDLLTGGGGMFETSGMEEQYMAPRRLSGTRTV